MSNADTERRFVQLLESAPDALVIVDRQGQIELINRQTERMFGYGREELLGRPVEILIPRRYHARHVEHRADYSMSPRTRPMGSGLELYGVRKDGGEFPVEISLSPLETEEGMLVSAAIRDVTEQRKSQDQLRHYAEQLQQSNLDLQQFAYVASHDLQEPLRTIATFCDLLHQHYGGKLDAEGDQWLMFVIDGARRMQALVQALLAYARLESRVQTWEDVSCDQIHDDAVTNLRSAIVEAGGEVTRDALPIVRGDASQLAQLFQNLLSNALKFRGSQPVKIHVSAAEQEGVHVFSVRDNGLGIDPRHHERVFELFKRLHPADRYPGAGMGLSLCRKVVLRHGGRIWVESELGRGSTFYFTIPVEGAPQP